MKMKRVANYMALQTVLYSVGGMENLHVYSRRDGYAGNDIYRGLHKEFKDREKYAYCKVSGITADESVLHIGIETE